MSPDACQQCAKPVRNATIAQDWDQFCEEACIAHNPRKPCAKAFCNNGGQCSMSPTPCGDSDGEEAEEGDFDWDGWCQDRCTASQPPNVPCHTASCNAGGQCTKSSHACDGFREDAYTYEVCAKARCNKGGQCTHSPASCCELPDDPAAAGDDRPARREDCL